MRPRTLIGTEELARRLGDPLWVVIDCRHELGDPLAGRAEYRRAHLPGAVFMDGEEDLAAPLTGRNGRHPLPSVEAFAERLALAGVGNAAQVIVYDAQMGVFASRLWWMLRWLGHDAVAVLDGGWTRWVNERRPVSSEQPAPRRAHFSAAPRAMAIDAAGVMASLGGGTLLLDARSPERFRGENETLDPVGGRIPGAANRFFRDNLDGLCFKRPEALRAEFDALLAGRAPSDLVHYCGSGVSACHNLLAMEIAGLPGGQLYPGSWSEWCADPARPRAQG